MSEQDEFYVGYQPNMPTGLAKRFKRWVPLLAVFVLLLGVALVLLQRGFSNGFYDRTGFATVEGTIIKAPLPFIRAEVGTNLLGEPVYRNILLLDFGKSGADWLIPVYERMMDGPIEAFRVKLEGKLIYRDGISLFELNGQEAALKDWTKHAEVPKLPVPQAGSEVKLSGEIIDPKCYFGVMKPGEGKPHRSCAVRCISGGIPPVLVVEQEGYRQYYLLVGPMGEPINQEVLSRVGEPVIVSGKMHQLEEWDLIYLDPATGLYSER